MHTTTNHIYAGETEGGYDRTCGVEERWGKANPSFWGQSSWEGGEKYNKMDAFIKIIIFLAGLSI